MARRTLMLKFARWHIWLGWAAAVPLLLWVVSGIFMTLRPIDEVRGERLRRAPPAMAAQPLAPPRLTGPVTRLALVQEGGRAVWVVTGADKRQARYAASDGAALGPVGVIEARGLAEAVYAGPARLESVRLYPADQPPLDLRRNRPSWQARFGDGTHIYIDADTGEVLALRSKWWRAYDLMWGLHIMDPVGREDTSHALLWVFGALALVTSTIGTVLLFRRRKAAR